jgi:hypothetical protein
MKSNSLLNILCMVAVLGIASMTFSFAQTSMADKGGVPNDSALEGKACDNSDNRNERFHERLSDDNTNNDKGQNQAHDNSEHNNKGVENNNC